MAVCNLFKKLSNATGEFIMFSQYAEDLTRNNSQGYNYRVTPSKFIAADIDFTKFVGDKQDLNVSFPQYLQNYFENGCAICKTNNNIDWNPTISTNLFWNAMINSGLINIVEQNKVNDLKYYVNEFKWIGDINIQSYDEMKGMGYSEIYCFIPNSAESTRYGCSNYTTLSSLISSKDVVEGYKDSEFTENMISGVGISGISYYPEKSIDFYYDKKEYGVSVLDEEKFDINCIIVLYDIYNIDDDGNSNVIYQHIPLGIYLPGCFEGTNVKNSITKWVHNSSIYNSGTSYGIRICSRFSVSPNSDNIKITEVSSVDSDEYASLTQVMGGIADNLDAMLDISEEAVFKSNALKDTLAMFKNSRTNVPYPVELYGKNYWFVNGRNTGIVIPDGNPCEAYDDDDIKNAILIWDGVDASLTLELYSINEFGEKEYVEKQYPTGEQPAADIQVKWRLFNKYTYESITPDKLYLTYPDGRELELNPTMETFIIKGVTNDGKYDLTAVYSAEVDNEITEHNITGTLDFKFCLPIYFGLIGSVGDQVGSDSADSIIKDIISGLYNIDEINGIKKLILPSESNRIQFISQGNRIVYAYPKEYGELLTVINRNSMDECIHDFELVTIPVKFNKNGSEESLDYYFYYTTDNTSNDIEVSFDFMNINKRINDIINYNK